MKRRLLFRADGSSAIGYGHVHRCLSLSSLLHVHFDCVFISHTRPSFLAEHLQNLNITLLTVNEIAYSHPDTRKMNEEVAFDMDVLIDDGDVLVLDGYWFGPEFQQRAKLRGATVVYLDDLVEFKQVADVVINQSPGLKPDIYDKLINGYTKVFVGPSYTTVSVPDRVKHSRGVFEKFSRLLLCMGGADPKKVTVSVIRQYQALITKFDEVVVLLGAGFQNLQEVASAINKSNTRIETNLPKEKVYNLMQWASSAILPASTMAIEYAHVGGLLGIIQTAENQKYFYKGLLELNCAVALDKLEYASSEQVDTILDAQRKVFDGRAHERLVKIFNELIRQN